ncbi:rod shape-determining protein MreD [Alicyclobacillus fastidiosus]|uniref:Rod shape-determining protein MreD n=1 Tax=Alicyclobacillus fastidiosus TaxID=392011 RepID=A0ABY6ZMU2_9BACL|nr:rod shape-determining protein MreD [Alicyclobacillus fastidiosus]WAH44258.1 rod shape-determining protein MreD [Alicyclobacillus fastidiosus]GMA60580.1 rod shape-determining protein MreD [Alicyclobacillus fastidiosus]
MKLAIAFLMLWAGLILEATLFQIPPMNVVHPGFVLVLLVLIALMRGPNTAVVMAVIIGLVEDISYGSFIGLNAFSYGLVAYFSGAVFGQFLRRNLAVTFINTLIMTFMYTWITYGLTRLFDVTADRPIFVLQQSLITMMINGLLVLMLYPLVTKLFSEGQRNRYDISGGDM